MNLFVQSMLFLGTFLLIVRTIAYLIKIRDTNKQIYRIIKINIHGIVTHYPQIYYRTISGEHWHFYYDGRKSIGFSTNQEAFEYIEDVKALREVGL